MPKKASSKNVHSELSKRIKELRESLGWSQGELAAKLTVSRTQVVAWENNRESPSIEKLQEMAAIDAAPLLIRLWFWRQAIPELEKLKAAIREDVLLRTSRASGEDIVVLDVFKSFLNKDGAVLPVQFDGKTFELPAKALAHPESTACVVVSPSAHFTGPLPAPLGTSDLVIVDRSEIVPREFLQRQEEQKQRMAAILFPSLPEELELNFSPSERKRLVSARANVDTMRRQIEIKAKASPEMGRADEVSGEQLWQAIRANMRRPTVLYGWLEKQHASERAQHAVFEDQDPRWRLFFYLDSRRTKGIALTGWIKDEDDISTGGGPLLHNAEIFGAVIGWLSNPRGLADHKTEIPW